MEANKEHPKSTYLICIALKSLSKTARVKSSRFEDILRRKLGSEKYLKFSFGILDNKRVQNLNEGSFYEDSRS